VIPSLLLLLVALAAACHQTAKKTGSPSALETHQERQHTTPIDSPLLKQVVDAAIMQTSYTHYYDGSYVKLDYPGGDVPLERGACTDVIIRAFRKGGVDLQREIHEDMSRSFASYPHKYGLSQPDSNIDHRRVPNLMTFFERRGKARATTEDPGDYLPGDVVAWDLGEGMTHIGIVINIFSERTGHYLMVHNMGAARVEDVLFSWRVIGHYRYFQ
jgi:uncharacterized protein YijF (DUF1287 family)